MLPSGHVSIHYTHTHTRPRTHPCTTNCLGELTSVHHHGQRAFRHFHVHVCMYRHIIVRDIRHRSTGTTMVARVPFVHRLTRRKRFDNVQKPLLTCDLRIRYLVPHNQKDHLIRRRIPFYTLWDCTSAWPCSFACRAFASRMATMRACFLACFLALAAWRENNIPHTPAT